MLSNNCTDQCLNTSCITYTSSSGETSFRCDEDDNNKNIILIIISVLSFLLLVTGIFVAIIKFRKKQRIFSTINNRIIFDNKDIMENDVIEVKKLNKDLSLDKKQIISSPYFYNNRPPDKANKKFNKPEDIVKNLKKFDIRQSRSASENLINDIIKHDSEMEEKVGSKIYLEASPGLVASPYRKRRSKFTYSEIKQNSKDGVCFDIINVSKSSNKI